MPLITKAEYKQWASPGMNTDRDDELDVLIDAAEEWIEDVADWKVEQDTYTIHLDGNDAIGPSGNILLMPAKYRPVIHTGGDLVTLTEDGSSLSVTATYDTSKDVMLVGANEERRCELVKNSTPWSSGYRNVAVTFKAGYTTIPSQVKQLARELVHVMLRTPQATLKSGKSTRSGSVSIARQLSAESQALIDSWHRLNV